MVIMSAPKAAICFASGLGIMRIFDALNDVNNVKSTVKYVKQYGGMADCAVCYTIDPKYPKLSPSRRVRSRIKSFCDIIYCV